MITFTAANLGWFIIILTICISMIAFMIGYIMGEKKESDRIIDYCIDMVEEIDSRDDIDIEKKARLGLAYLKEARGFVTANLAYKKLTATSPDVAKNPAIVLSVGTVKLELVNKETPEKEAAAG